LLSARGVTRPREIRKNPDLVGRAMYSERMRAAREPAWPALLTKWNALPPPGGAAGLAPQLPGTAAALPADRKTLKLPMLIATLTHQRVGSRPRRCESANATSSRRTRFYHRSSFSSTADRQVHTSSMMHFDVSNAARELHGNGHPCKFRSFFSCWCFLMEREMSWLILCSL
jgi:hypothetical protein